MSEMRDLMLRSLDRIVDDTLDINARVAADSNGQWPQKLWAALEEQGMTAIGEVAEGDLGFADSMALVGRAAFHAVPLPWARRCWRDGFWVVWASISPRGR